jgi:hypothetical protein
MNCLRKMTKSKKAKVVSTPTVFCMGPQRNLAEIHVTLKIYDNGHQNVIDCPHLDSIGRCQRSYQDRSYEPEIACAGQRIYDSCCRQS